MKPSGSYNSWKSASAAWLAASVWLAACSSDPPAAQPIAGVSGAGAGGAAGAGGTAAFVPGSPTFSAIFQEIIVGTGCNGGPTCHAGTAAGQLKMTARADAYKALVGVKALGINLLMNGTPNCRDSMLTRVVAGDPMSSLFFKKVASATPECGTTMPPSGALPADKIEQIRMWITAGAKDD